jgi:hypothetical protein
LDPEAQNLVSSVMEPALEPRALNGLNSCRIFDLPEELGRAACLVTSTPYGFNCFRPNRLNDFAEVYNSAIKKDPLDPAVILPTHILIGLDKQGNCRLIPEDDTCRTQAAVPLGAAKSFLKRL